MRQASNSLLIADAPQEGPLGQALGGPLPTACPLRGPARRTAMRPRAGSARPRWRRSPSS